MAEDTCSSEAALPYTHTPGERLTGTATCPCKPIQTDMLPSIAWAFGHSAPWLNSTTSSAGVTPSNQTTSYHDEGRARYTAPEPPTATVGESLGVSPVYVTEGALPAPPPPIASYYFPPSPYASVSPPALTPIDKHCVLNSDSGGRCPFNVNGKTNRQYYLHILTHIGGELQLIRGAGLRVGSPQVLTTPERVDRAESHAWRCPAPGCAYWSMARSLVSRHLKEHHSGHLRVDDRTVSQSLIDGVKPPEFVIQDILRDDIEWQQMTWILNA
ncbi:hypothetical protein JB92DRAFT_3097265 [Gautieria morchelliformis]|nr:hypothetical protein JB92DRAFT_3097265 [Gautieria morchelliformis]